MATNGKIGDNHRTGQVKGRTQIFNPDTLRWIKRDTESGQFIGVKKDRTKWKRVRREKR